MAHLAESAPPVVSRGQLSDANAWIRHPARPADAAQARQFEAILQAEFARLNELAERMGGPPQPFTALRTKQARRELMEIHGYIDEVRHLLQALRDRFGTTQ